MDYFLLSYSKAYLNNLSLSIILLKRTSILLSLMASLIFFLCLISLFLLERYLFSVSCFFCLFVCLFVFCFVLFCFFQPMKIVFFFKLLVIVYYLIFLLYFPKSVFFENRFWKIKPRYQIISNK